MLLPVFMLICLSVQLCMGMDDIQVVTVASLGGKNKMNSVSFEVKDAVDSAMIEYNKKSKSQNLFKLDMITSATSQVTNMIHYEIDAVIGETDCLKSKQPKPKNCNFLGKKVNCHFTMTKDSNTNKYILDTYKCD